MFQRTSETFRGHSESVRDEIVAGRASFDVPLNRLSVCAFADVAGSFFRGSDDTQVFPHQWSHLPR